MNTFVATCEPLLARTTMKPGRQSGNGKISSLITIGKLQVPSRSTVTSRW